ncbi:hypothetical protein D3C80_1603430 [compost metagenome]
MLKQAEKGALSELKGEAADQAQERQRDQQHLEAVAEAKRLAIAARIEAEKAEALKADTKTTLG